MKTDHTQPPFVIVDDIYEIMISGMSANGDQEYCAKALGKTIKRTMANASMILDALNSHSELTSYREYVDGKIELGEMPLTFDGWLKMEKAISETL